LDENTLVVASTDFTHYGPNYNYMPFSDDLPRNIEKLDMAAYEPIRAKDSAAFRRFCEETGATICGREAVSVLLAMLPPQAETHLLKYDTSGRIVGDYANSVSYLAIAFTGAWPDRTTTLPETTPAKLSAEERHRLLHLARATLDFFYVHGRPPALEDLDIELTPTMRRISGAFVTLTRDGHLRGCIGDIYPTRPLYESVMSNALAAAVRDPRFRPVGADEWPKLAVELSALTAPREVASFEDIIIGKHGIVMAKGDRRAVYLPQVAPEQNWTREETLQHLSQKARLPPDAWREGARFKVFEAEVFGEEGKNGVME
jgi:AmmeMemoRadiSam system protein A